jgi:hypothetical protein
VTQSAAEQQWLPLATDCIVISKDVTGLDRQSLIAWRSVVRCAHRRRGWLIVVVVENENAFLQTLLLQRARPSGVHSLHVPERWHPLRGLSHRLDGPARPMGGAEAQ